MALRGTLTHRKTRRLARLLGISPAFALGLAEALWHVTAEQAPNGAIGKMSDEDIAEEMFYDGDPAALVRALVTANFLDTDDEHRLIVHDWHLHSDDATDMKVARSGNPYYANGARARMRRLSREDRDKLCAQSATPREPVRTKCHTVRTVCAQSATKSHEKPLPEPEPEPEPALKPLAPAPPPPGDSKNPPSPRKSSQRSVPDERFADFKRAIEAYWQHKNSEIPLPWDGSEAKRLTEFLKACPSLEIEKFRDMLRNRSRSDVVHTERPRAWIASLTDYAGGPLDRFRRQSGPESDMPEARVGMADPGSGVDVQRIFSAALEVCRAQPVDETDSEYAAYLAAESIARLPEAKALDRKSLAQDFEVFVGILRRRMHANSQGVVTC